MPADAWAIERWSPQKARVGVACSGGGIRSASFCLGALQAIDASTPDGDGLRRVDYVSAVSGGGYVAGGWAVTHSASTGGSSTVAPDPPIYAPGSPEEERVRRNSSLLQNGRLIAAGIGRLTAGLTVNLLLLWLSMIAVAAPVGWLVSSWLVHPELQARTPLIEIEEQPSLVRDDEFLPESNVVHRSGLRQVSPIACSSGQCPAWEVVGLRLQQADVDAWSLDGRRLDLSGPDGPRVEFDPSQPAIVIVDDAQVQVVQQPRVVVVQGDVLEHPGGSADDDVPSLSVDRQPELAVDGETSTVTDSLSLTVVEDPRLVQRSGTTGRPPLTFAWWMGPVTVAMLALMILAGLARIVARPVGPTNTRFLRWVVRVSSVAALSCALLFYVVPWLIVTVPTAIASIPSWLPLLGGDQITDSALVNATALSFLGTLVFTGIRALRAPAVSAARRWPQTVAQVVLLVVAVVVGTVMLVDVLEVAAANGPTGHLSDFAWYPTFRVGSGDLYFSVSDVGRWAAVIGVLAFWATVADAHSWSLFGFYKRWLHRAFVSTRSARSPRSGTFPGAPEPAGWLDYSIETTWWKHGRLASSSDSASSDDEPSTAPQLLLCCAVNLNGPDEAATSRRAGSFVFADDYVGGPDVGWMGTEDYVTRLPKSRRKDVTVLATMAISGAAFSPGMGKMSLGTIGGLFAVANARLGVWLPHPRAVAAVDRWPGLWRRPGWLWWGREIIQRFREDASYVYVSDGGHWENLGVIELLRRGCNRVYLVSAAGDGQHGFAMIGDAIALAREELGIEIEGLDLDQIRPRGGDPGDGEQTLVDADGASRRFAPSEYVVGTLRRCGEETPFGNIVVLEATLTAGMPWDVQAHAESHPEFPDDTTVDQFFDHRQFESYRRLGHHQMSAALEAVPLP